MALGGLSRFEAVLLTAFLAVNIICTTLGLPDTGTIAKRLGSISIINLMPLALGSRMNIIAARCGIHLRVLDQLHRWFGIVAAVECALHSIIFAIPENRDA
jgi:hypothetical protein